MSSAGLRLRANRDLFSCKVDLSTDFGGIPKRPTGADCKSAGLRLRWFESTSLHQFHKLHQVSRRWVRTTGSTNLSGTNLNSRRLAPKGRVSWTRRVIHLPPPVSQIAARFRGGG